MEKKKKNIFTTGIFAALLLLVLAVLVLFLGLYNESAGMSYAANGGSFGRSFGDYIKYHFKALDAAFTTPVGLIVFIVFTVITIVLAVLNVLKGQEGKLIARGVAFSVLALIPVIDLLAVKDPYIALVFKNEDFGGNTSSYLGEKILMIVITLFAIAAIVMCYLVAIQTLLLYKKKKVLQEDAPDVVTDAIPNNEIVEPVLEEEKKEREINLDELTEDVLEELTEEEMEKLLVDKETLAAIVKEIVREVVRDEISHSNVNEQESVKTPNITGATFGGPLVVQYFNGGINGVTAPAAAPIPQCRKVEEVKVEEVKVAEPAPVEEAPAPTPVAEAPKAEEPAPAPAPVEEAPKAEEPAPAVEEPVEFNEQADDEENASNPSNPIIRIPFTERMINADYNLQRNYNNIKNEILSYGVKSRVSNSGDTFRLHRKTYCKLTIAGKGLKLYFALDPKDYADSTIPVGDASNKHTYEAIPLVFKVKSDLSVKRCKQLITDLMAKENLTQGVVETTDWSHNFESIDDED